MTTTTNETEQQQSQHPIQLGDWYLIIWGGEWTEVYINDLSKNLVQFTKINWISTFGVWMTKTEFLETRKAELIATGKTSWWRKLPPMTLFVPLYSRIPLNP